MKKLIQQGAEAKIFLTTDSFTKKIITKERVSKGYRHPQLNEQIIKRRTKSETKLLIKALSKNTQVPKILNANEKGEPINRFSIKMQYIQGDRLSETLNNYPEKKQFEIMQQLGKQTAILHENNIIHGDLTTSNTILKNNKLYLIDFGLGFISTKIEDRAVDLHLIKQALEAKHFQNHEKLFKEFLKTYKDNEVIKRLEIVEKRGRYKH